MDIFFERTDQDSNKKIPTPYLNTNTVELTMPRYAEFIHPNHISIFTDAAKTYNCHILIRKTGRDSLRWIGEYGYTGKRADMKARIVNQSTVKMI